MAVCIKEIERVMEEFCPVCLAESWDNCGWQVLTSQKKVSKVLVTLTVSMGAIKTAIEKNCDVIVAHHPIIFKAMKSITPESLPGNVVLEAIKHNISIFSAHTNADKTAGGINDLLADKFNLKNTTPLLPEKADKSIGLGRTGTLEKPVKLQTFLNTIKETLNVTQLKVINHCNKTEVHRVAVCGGSGGSLINDIPEDIDIYITGDIKYHEALESMNFVVVDANHIETEELIVDKFKMILEELDIDVITFNSEAPWEIY